MSEFRATAPDSLWLSGSYQRDTLAIHFTWRNRPDQVSAALTEVEAALAPFDARPHWGKASHIQAGQPERLYPRLGDARALFERLDPGAGSATRGWSGWASANPAGAAWFPARVSEARVQRGAPR